jgi:transcriptional regulator with GAF, ATPase, and Fis domain
MKERTITTTGLQTVPQAREEPPALGVAVVYQRAPCLPVPHRVDRPLRIGRDDAAEITMDDPALSRFHALLEPASGGVRVTDLGSRNGTLVGGVRVAGDPTFAAAGTTIRLGRTLLLVLRDVIPFERETENPFVALVGGPSLAQVRRLIGTLATSSTTVLLEGETGTGKEVVARSLHDHSGRAGRFVAVNCAALAEELVESELFGHARGSFSGATGPRAGLFRSADGGTLLLDEIGELSPQVQAKLLRAIETGEVRSVGEDLDVHVDVRIIAATNRDLAEMVARGAFRADLMHRIAAARIRLPPLRERPEDVPRLCEHFLRTDELRVSVGLIDLLMARRWPGNVRELKHALMAAAAAAKREGRDQVRAEDAQLGDMPGEASEVSVRARIVRALSAADGNVTRAAQDLGVARSGFYETLRRLNIDPVAYRKS